jgi:NAD(P)-dependent dehydrogenase (short-subunit alcohol dehydrogenase family)
MTSPLAETVLLTGSNRGIGLEFAQQLADSVDTLYATCRRPDEAADLRDLASAQASTVRVLPLDVTDADSIEMAHKLVATDSGRVDLLINNAGVNGGGSSDRFETTDAETMMHTYRVNAVGPHLLVQAFADLLRRAGEEGGARVVNITSQLGSIANTRGGTWQSYKASKAALNMCTRLQHGALQEDDVCVVSMHPGWVQTDMGGSNARLTPQESVASMVDVIDDLSMDDGGRFLTYAGKERPW